MKKSIYNPSEVIYLSGDINYTEVYLQGGKKVVSSFTLLRHEEKLKSFIRISRKHLINPQYLIGYALKGSYMEVKMKGSNCLKVSRRRIKEVLPEIKTLV